MTEVEELLAALMLDLAADAESSKFKGAVSELRERTEGRYGLGRFSGGFEGALDFLADRGIAKIHSYPGVEDYVSIDMSETGQLLFYMLAREETETVGFSMTPQNPLYRIINSYADVGSTWLHDYALAMRNTADDPTVNTAARSESWTGRYTVSEPDKVRIREALIEMRRTIESLPLTNSERSNAIAALDAIESLAEAADPAWALILKILRSPVLGNVTALVALVVSVITA